MKPTSGFQKAPGEPESFQGAEECGWDLTTLSAVLPDRVGLGSPLPGL